jgi:DNA polymerase alpha subunit B
MGAGEVLDAGYTNLPQPKTRLPLINNTDGERLAADLTFLSNPAHITLNDDVTIALCSTDALFHMGAEEIARNPLMPDRIGRMASHLLQQRHMYPLFPPANEDDRYEHVDQTQLDALTIEELPHILILPSQWHPFIKLIDGVLVINPGHVAKRRANGTFLHLHIRADGEERLGARILRLG